MTETQTQPKFSAEVWAAFWAAPDVARVGAVLADDIVGYWQGDPTPVRGKEPYVGKIAELVGTGPDGPIAIRGLDRVRARDGVVVENVIRYDLVEPV